MWCESSGVLQCQVRHYFLWFPFNRLLFRFFQDAETSVDASLSSIIVAAITLITVSYKPSLTIANISTFQVVLVCLLGGKASRRQLMLVSQFGVTVCLFTMALYFLLGDLDMADSIR